ncbi:NPCBM/NEW2 domain-containing protein [Streptomyces sp. NPDC003393]
MLWSSRTVAGGEPAVPVHVSLADRDTVRLVVEPHRPFDTVTLADWARSRFTCGQAPVTGPFGRGGPVPPARVRPGRRPR